MHPREASGQEFPEKHLSRIHRAPHGNSRWVHDGRQCVRCFVAHVSEYQIEDHRLFVDAATLSGRKWETTRLCSRLHDILGQFRD